MNLCTRYLGLELPHPFLVGASPLIYDIDRACQLEEAGAAGLVMHSLFEEQIVQERIHGLGSGDEDDQPPELRNLPLKPDAYLHHIEALKARLDIPVIASINGIHSGTWVEYARLIEQAGADALELNLYFTPRSDTDPSAEIENRIYAIVRSVKSQTRLPLAVKIAPFFTGLPRFVSRLEEAGAQAVVLFNSFFQPDIDIENMRYVDNLQLSQRDALLLRTRWLASLYGRTGLSLSLSGGVGTHEDAIKGLMAGATTVQLVSCLLRNGPPYLSQFLGQFADWMEKNQFETLDQVRGILSFVHSSNTESLCRADYLRVIQNWKDS
jgi:dihydroorotate dehydrogenase (fumarate)